MSKPHNSLYIRPPQIPSCLRLQFYLQSPKPYPHWVLQHVLSWDLISWEPAWHITKLPHFSKCMPCLCWLLTPGPSAGLLSSSWPLCCQHPCLCPTVAHSCCTPPLVQPVAKIISTFVFFPAEILGQVSNTEPVRRKEQNIWMKHGPITP